MDWHSYFDYNAQTGDLTWKERPRSAYKTPGSHGASMKHVGLLVGTRYLDESGRRKCVDVGLWIDTPAGMKRKNFRQHRIIWEMHFGSVPHGFVIDHINGDPWDNRLVNMRLATPCENARNCNYRPNRTGFRGIVQVGTTWKAYITIKRKRTYIGSFPSKGLAAVARAKYELQHHGKFSSVYRKHLINPRT